MRLTPYQSQYFAWLLSRRTASDSPDMLASTLVDAQVDLNPHQVDAALFAFHSPLSKGVILADEVGLGKTIEAGLVIAQRWAERRRRILVVVPANLRKQWHQELQEKFGLDALILEARSYNQLRKEGGRPFESAGKIVICSYQFAKTKADELREVPWDLVVLDEAHRLRNVYKAGNVIGKAIKESLAHARKVLLTATPLQNSLNDLYGLVSLIDDRVFGDLASFREQFGNLGGAHAFQVLRERLQPVCKRTLRRQVQPYISYTRRIPLVEQFTPSTDEQHLRELVAEYLRRPTLNALPGSQRQLITLVLWKLLASSSYAIAGALGTMADRLERELGTQPPSGEATLDDDYEAFDETREEWSEQPSDDQPQRDAAAAHEELKELREFQELAATIRDNAKGLALLQALDRGFAELQRLNAGRKALIFTESRRTQDYLLRLLESSPHAGKVVLFNGTNSGEQAKAIYADWLERHQGTDKITGSRTADTRAALVEHFRDRAEIMIATEAGAEGINLQFCSLVINFDLPWNPQRIEQRIGRCHRYGQKHDVVVVNFVDLTNPADKRVYELLAQKFQLFEGVFGASDEVLGAIGSGVDFERRIAEIYRTCREPAEIEDSFQQLQLDLSSEIDSAMLRTRQLLLENFDEAVQERLKVRQDASKSARSKFERLLMDLTQSELGECASYDDDGFTLHTLPSGMGQHDAPVGRYELPRRSSEAHVYRVAHPLAQALIEGARRRHLSPCSVRFRYGDHGPRIVTLESLRGQSGWLAVRVFSTEALGMADDEVLVAAITDDGNLLHEDDPAKLLRLPADIQHEVEVPDAASTALSAALAGFEADCIRRAERRNIEFFDAEVRKIEGWAEDLKSTLEAAVKEVDRQIKEIRRLAAAAPSLEEKLAHQKKQREVEQTRTQLRRSLFDRQDQIDAQRDELIAELERRLARTEARTDVFTIRWELV